MADIGIAPVNAAAAVPVVDPGLTALTSSTQMAAAAMVPFLQLAAVLAVVAKLLEWGFGFAFGKK